MATLKNGPNEGFSGKVGSVVGSSWKGIDYIRGLPAKRKNKPGTLEKNNRSRFGFVFNNGCIPLSPFMLFALCTFLIR